MNRLFAWDLSYYEQMASFVKEKKTHHADDVLRVPFAFYRDPDVAQRERKQIFNIFPLPLVHCSEIPAPSTHVAKTIMGRPLLFTRDKNGVAHAFENVCRHRAAQVVKDGCGKGGKFSCPYHGWTYSAEGKLIGVPWKEGFEGMDRAKHGLTELPCEERHGFVWVILTPERSINVAAFLGAEMDALLGSLGFEGMTQMNETPAFPTVMPMECNWKSLVAAFLETYHFSMVHMNGILAKFALPNTGLVKEHGRHNIQLNASPGMLDYVDQPIEKWTEIPMTSSIFIFPFTNLTVSERGANCMQMHPTADGNPQRSNLVLTFLGDPVYTPEMVAPVYDAVLNEDVAVLRTLQATQPTASHPYEIVGRNEAGVQHAFKAIAAEVGVELPVGF